MSKIFFLAFRIFCAGGVRFFSPVVLGRSADMRLIYSLIRGHAPESLFNWSRPSPLCPPLPRVAPLSLLFIQSAMRKRKLIFGWIHRICRNCCFCWELSLFFRDFFVDSNRFVVYLEFSFNFSVKMFVIQNTRF